MIKLKIYILLTGILSFYAMSPAVSAGWAWLSGDISMTDSRSGTRHAAAPDAAAAPEGALPSRWWQAVWLPLMLAVALPGYIGFCQIRRRPDEPSGTMDLLAAGRYLESLAAKDGPTGIANRRHFLAEAERAIEQAGRTGRPHSLLLIEIDDFETLNDNWGQLAGDRILRSVASHIGGRLRAGDLFGRLGGARLAVLIPETDERAAWLVAERLRAAVADGRHEIPIGIIPVTVSIGLATGGNAPGNLQILLDRAGRGLHSPKDGGCGSGAAGALLEMARPA